MIKAINVSIKKIIFETLNIKSDTIGAFASGLCMVHCLATPFFFIASACSASCCSNTPLWWQWMDYIFLGISFFAIQQASKSSTKHWVVQGLWFSWLTLFLLILNIKLELLHLPPNFKFFPAFMLVFLHVYNMRYCQCEKDCC
jgi:hypothetical protein|tara:strand:+ start:527 stop:955 length:429 start_codon:yes stop_codon:yes gene_type:complete